MSKNKSKATYIVYSTRDELIITTPKREVATLHDYFGNGMDRDFDEYAREEFYAPALSIESGVKVRWG